MKVKILRSFLLLLMLFASSSQVGDATGSVTISGRTSSKLCLWNEATGMVPDQTVVLDSFAMSNLVKSPPFAQKSTVLGVKSNVMKWYVKAQASIESTDPLANAMLGKITFNVTRLSGANVSIPTAAGTLADYAQKRLLCQGNDPTEGTFIQTEYAQTERVRDSMVAIVRYSLEPTP
jgi:hypothetical protein